MEMISLVKYIKIKIFLIIKSSQLEKSTFKF